MTFAIETRTKAKIKDVRVLSQKNRPADENPGVQLPFSMKLSNHVLSTLDGALKSFLFTKDAGGTPTVTKRKDEKTGTLDGVEAVTDLPKLSSAGTKLKVLPWAEEVTGGLMHVHFATTDLEIDDCIAHTFRIKPQEGGTVQLDFVIDAPNASEKVFAKLAKYKSREVEITFEQHEVEDGQQRIDDEAPPPKASGRAKQKDATEQFIGQHAPH